MKIGFYHHTFIDGSGIDNVIKYTSLFLSKNNDVKINTLFSNIKNLKIKVDTFSKSKRKSIFSIYNPFTAYKIIKSVKNYDLVISHMFPINFLVSLGSLIYKTPHFAYFWGIPPTWTVTTIKEKLYHWLVHYTELLIPKIGVTCSLVPNLFIKKWNKNFSALVFPMHGVDLKKFSIKNKDNKKIINLKKRFYIPHDAKIIFTLGRILPYKGVDLLIKSFEIVRRSCPNTYLIIGGIAWNKKYITYLKSISDNHVIFTGFISDDDLINYYSMCDIYASASKWEGQLCPEAFAFKKPYVAFDTTSHKYTIKNGENGFLIKPYNFYNFAKKIIFFIENENIRSKFGEKGYHWVKNFDYNLIVKNFENIIKSTLSQKNEN